MATHISGRIGKNQFEILDKIAEMEKTDRSTVLRKIIDIGSKEYLKQKAAELYRKGKISIGKAAELAELSLWEMYEHLDKEGITLRIDRKALQERLEDDLGA